MRQCPRSVVSWESQGRELGRLLGSWGQETQAARPALPLTLCDLGQLLPFWASFPPAVGGVLASPRSRDSGQSFGRPQKRC